MNFVGGCAALLAGHDQKRRRGAIARLPPRYISCKCKAIGSVRHCVNTDELRDFLISDEDRYRFYTSDKAKKLVRERLPVREESDDHRETAAKRIYAIRNGIVHTKASDEYEEPLFPFDPATKYLWHDIDLVEFLARKVLIASNRPLHL